MGESQTWAGDLLDRKPLADYLTKSLKAQSASLAASERGLTVALDADWGAGKSFFVINWCDELRAAGHPVVYFDAWENDIGDEAAISLMAAILSEIKVYLPKAELVVEKANQLRKKSIKNLRRALMPAAGLVIKGVIKKTTSIAVDELMDVFVESNEDDGEGSSIKMDDVLDGLFEKALLEHDSRKQELIAFKSSLTGLLGLVCGNGKNIPLFVFVDELDRCRPSYAIKLLEEIKHIFGIKDVVYVVSTNIDQLQSSVRAVYGSDFDGRRYLRRLFNREYSLPKVGGTGFAKGFIARTGWSPPNFELGLPRQSQSAGENLLSRILGF
ncbi:P-loop NTPase fold protein [Xanthomonas sp. LF07-6]|uniref:KAP family P-loop NTPase fold protein n=1 Tax=Xanthomonas sp. LF07-6 TaxID=3097550 RepID=UPI002A815135|nr:P-loop NTPase fold protein [Xanthomonas sp. LF07-6]MDY4341302.1 P-loop NTPase fold protein [Xanthomonas sp. LF07-6]